MKKLVILLILMTVSASSLFKGLFFPCEMYIFFTILSLLSAFYLFLKVVNMERINLKDWSIYLGSALILAYILSFFTAVNLRGNIETVLQYVMYFMIFLVVYDYFREKINHITAFFTVPLICAGLIAAITGLAGYTMAFPELADTMNGERIGSTFQYANTAAIYFLMLVILTVSMIINSRSIFIKAALTGMGNVIFMALFFTASRGVYIVVPFITFFVLILAMPKGARLKCVGYVICISLPILAGMKGYYANAKIMNVVSASKWLTLSAGISVIASLAFSYLIKLNLSKKIKYIVSGVVSVAALTVFFINAKYILSSVSAFLVQNIPQSIMARISDINLQTFSAAIRIEFYLDAFKLIKDNWLFGLGGGGFASLYQSVQSVYYAARLVHNHYLQVFVESGILGFLSFFLLAVLACVYFIYARVKIKDVKVKVYVAGATCAFIALVCHSAIDFNLSYSAMSLIYWCMIGIAAAYFFNARGDVLEKPKKFKVKVIVVPAFLLVLCLAVAVISGRLIKAPYYGNLGEEYKKQVQAETAIGYYEKAADLDDMNAAYHAELADLYSWKAYCSKTRDERKEWIGKAISEGEEAIRLDPYYPYYNSILTKAYFSAGENIKGCEQALKLVSVQPRVSGNYELLAKGYIEGGLQYLRENHVEKGKDYISRCAEIDKYPDVVMNAGMSFYKGKALLLLGDFQQAEELFKVAREGSLELKMESDRLLYIINEETGRAEENEKYKGVMWMGVVKLTPVYKEFKHIIGSKILE